MKPGLICIFVFVKLCCTANDFFPFESEEHLQKKMADIANHAEVPYPLLTQTMSRSEIESHALRRARSSVDRRQFEFDERSFITKLKDEIHLLEIGEDLVFLGLDNRHYRGDFRGFNDSILFVGGFQVPIRHVPDDLRRRRSEVARNQYIQTKLRAEKRRQNQLMESEITKQKEEFANEFYVATGYYLGRNGEWYDRNQLNEMLKSSAINLEYVRMITTGVEKAKEKIEQGETNSAKALLQELLNKYGDAPNISLVKDILNNL